MRTPRSTPTLSRLAPVLLTPVLLALAVLMVAALPVRAAEMVYIWEKGCGYCEQWDEEIAPIWDKTDEGQRLPLRKVRISEPLPEDLKDIGPLNYTPTFVLVHEGEEIGRIPGYNPEFFWAFVNALIDKLDARLAEEKAQEG